MEDMRKDLYKKNMNYSSYNATVQYGKQKNNIEGVSELLEKLDTVESATYERNVENIINSSYQEEARLQNESDTWLEKKNKVKKLTIVIGLIWLLTGIICLIKNDSILEIVHPLIFWPAIVLAVVWFIFKKIYSEKEHACYKFKRSVLSQIDFETNKFSNICRKYYTDIDNLYLHSLSPEQYQIEIMRREMEKRDREHAAQMKQIQNSMSQMANSYEKAIKDMSSQLKTTNDELTTMRRNQEYWHRGY